MASKRDEKKLKRAREIQNYLSARSLEESEAQQARIQSGFETNLGILGMLGQEGTYGAQAGTWSPGSGLLGAAPESATYTAPTSAGSAYGKTTTFTGDPTSIFDTTSERARKSEAAGSLLYRGKYGKEFFEDFEKPREGILDPGKTAQAVSKMPVAHIISGQVAEAKGLTDPSSPFRQTLEQSIKNPIVEAGADALRESTRFIKNQTAKGGSARRTALQEAQQMLAIERSNRIVSQQLWQANLQFETWVRDYQKDTVNAAVNFTNGLGVNQYVQSMNAASQFLVGTAIPAAAKYQARALELSLNAKRQSLGKMILGAAMIAGSTAGGAYLGGGKGAEAGYKSGMAQAQIFGVAPASGVSSSSDTAAGLGAAAGTWAANRRQGTPNPLSIPGAPQGATSGGGYVDPGTEDIDWIGRR